MIKQSEAGVVGVRRDVFGVLSLRILQHPYFGKESRNGLIQFRTLRHRFCNHEGSGRGVARWIIIIVRITSELVCEQPIRDEIDKKSMKHLERRALELMR